MTNTSLSLRAVSLLIGLTAFFLSSPGYAKDGGDIVTDTLATKLVPGPVTFSVLLPPSYPNAESGFPLLFWLHGGSGSHRALRSAAPAFRAMWAAATLPEMVVVMPTATQSQYMDYRDGSQLWETFIVDQLLPHLQSQFRITKGKRATFIGGASMGGMGALKIGLKHLDTFGAIIAYEPYIDPAYEWKDAKAGGTSMFIVRDHAAAIRASGIHIYIEVGSEDVLGLHRGTDFLHNALYERRIQHEYRFVAGADHVGNSFAWRTPDGLAFLNRVLSLGAPDPSLDAFRKWAAGFKKRVGFVDPD
jgi:S-formylglutathione hydrolase